MLYANKQCNPIRLLAIDPGTDTLGVSLFELHPDTQRKILIMAYTYKASDHIAQRMQHSQWRYHDEKYVRLYMHGQHLYGLLQYYEPTIVVHESAFMGRFPKAYQGLTECLYQLQLTVREYNPYLPFEGITPMEVKYAINGIKKEEVAQAVSRITDLENLQTIFPTLDEHAIDSVAIGYTKLNQLLSELTWTI